MTDHSCRIAFFDAKPYDRDSFNPINEREFHYDIRYFKGHLTPDSVPLTRGTDKLCDLDSWMLRTSVLGHDGDGWLMVGDSAGFVNSVHREGSNLAMETGRLAAETLVELFKAGKAPSAANLSRYRAKLDDSFVMKDMKKYQKIPETLHNQRQFINDYPPLLNGAAHQFFTVDGRDKRTKEKEIVAAFMQRRSLFGLLGDAFKLWRATR